MVIFYKRLDRGTFVVPEPPSKTARHVEIDDATLDALLDGIDVNEGSSVRPRAKTH
jgi:transposase